MREPVLVVDDAPRIRNWLSTLLERHGFSVVRTADRTEASAVIRQLEAPLAGALIDVWLHSGPLGFDVARQVVDRFGDIPRRIFTGHDITDDLKAAGISLGVSILQKPFRRAVLEEFMVEVAASAPLRALPKLRRTVSGFCAAHHLSVVEARVLGLLCSGTPRSQIAFELDLSAETVKSQVRRLLAKTVAANVEGVLVRLLHECSQD